MSFLKKTSSFDTSPELKVKYEKARAYLLSQLGGNKELEKELLEKTEDIVVEKVTTKVIKEKANKAVVEKAQESVTVEEQKKIVEAQNNDGSFEIPRKVTEDLGATTTEDIKSSIRVTDERAKKFDTKVWTTFITVAYNNKVVGSKVKDQNQKAREWLHKQVGDEKLEEEILKSCEEVVVKKVAEKKKAESSSSSWGGWFKTVTDVGRSVTGTVTGAVSDVGKYTIDSISQTASQTAESAASLLQSRTSPEVAQKIASTQNTDGSITLTETITKEIDITPDNIEKSVQTYGVSDKLKSVPRNVWETALSIRYLTISSPQSQDKYKEQSEKARKYLIKELKDEKLVEEILTTSDKIIVEQSVQKEKKEAEAEVQNCTSTEKAREIVSSQKEDGSLEITDAVSKELDVESSDSLISSITSYFGNRSIKLPESKSLIDTAVTMSFLKKTSSFDTSPELKSKYEKARVYLLSQLGGDKELEKELLEKTENIVVEKVTTKVIKEKADKAVVEKAQESVTVEEQKKIVEAQNNDGSFEIPRKVTEDLGATTTSDIISSIRVTDERAKKFDTKVWTTFITVAYNNKVVGSKVKDQNQKAREWLHKQVGDEKLEEEILKSFEEVVVKKVAEKKKAESPSLLSTITVEKSYKDDVKKQPEAKGSKSVRELASSFETTKPAETPSKTTPKSAAPVETPSKTTPKSATPVETPSKTTPKPAAPVETPSKTPKPAETPSKTTPKPATPVETPSKTPKPAETQTESTTIETIELDKDVEEAITYDDDNDNEKADALDTIKSSVTTEVIYEVVSNQNDDGSIEGSETIYRQLDVPSEEKIVTTVQEYVTTEKLKNAKPSWIITAINISYLKNLADHHQGEWKTKYEKALQYLTKEIGNSKDVDELIDASNKYVVQKSTQKVITNKKKAAVLAMRSTTSEETVNDALSSQNADGSFEISKTITKELDNTSSEDLVKKAQSYIPSDKIKPEKSESIFKTAITLGFLRAAVDNTSGNLSEKYNQARKYLSSQIGDPKLEEDIIRASSRVVIDINSEKVEKESKDAAIREIQESTTPETSRAVVSKQNDDGSIEISEEITDKLNSPSSSSLVTSVTTYTTNKKLKTINPSIWATALSMQYLKNTSGQYKNNWEENYKKGREYIRSQVNDDNLVDEILETSDKYVSGGLTRKIVQRREQETLRVRKIEYNEEIKKASDSYWSQQFSIDDVRSICSSQNQDGSFTLHDSIKKQIKITNTDTIITSIKSYIRNQRLRAYKNSFFETVFTIYILKYILAEYESESNTACERGNAWLNQQLGGDKELEKELFNACEQYLVEESIKYLDVEVRDEVDENESQITLDVSEETRQVVFKYLQSRSIMDDARTVVESQNSDGSFPLHSSITEHLQISSIDDSVKGLTRYVGIKRLKNCDSLIWQTALAITYLKIVLIEYEDVWGDSCKKATEWISKQTDENELKELYSACNQYLIERGVDLYNNPTTEVSIKKLEADEKTITRIYNELRSDVTDEDARSITKSQSSNGSFTLHKKILEQLKISSPEAAVDSVKSYVGSLRLRRLDKSLWISAFTVTYFRKVLDKSETEWRTAINRTSSWISEQVHNAELEKELYSGCEQYLIQQGCEFLNSKTTTTKTEVNTDVFKKLSRSVNVGSDGRILSQEEAYLNSELIVVGAAARAKCKVKLESAQNKTLEDTSKATELALKYAEEEVDRLFTTNVTSDNRNKDDILLRAKRATKFLIEEYYKPGEDCC